MKAEAMWDSLAKGWDTPGVGLGDNDLRIIEKTRKYLHASDVVLDYGCATGSIALGIAGIVKEVHGIDLSSNMIGLAVSKAGEHEVSNVTFAQATIFDDRLKEASFDCILSLSILHLVENPTQVMNRIHHLLKPGGLCISATPCLGEKTLISILLNLPIFLLSRVGILPRVNFFSVAGLVASFTHANFQVMENERLAVRPIKECFIAARKL